MMVVSSQEAAAGAGVNFEFSLEEVKGDLFSCPDDESLAHCISQDVRMGKGIAVIFKKKFGGVDELLKQGKKRFGSYDFSYLSLAILFQYKPNK